MKTFRSFRSPSLQPDEVIRNAGELIKALEKTLENAAGTIDIVVGISLQLLDAARLPENEASSFANTLADAGVQAAEFRECAAQSRRAIEGER